MSNGFIDPAAARRRVQLERSRLREVRAAKPADRSDRRGNRLRLIVGSLGLSLLAWTAAIRALLWAGIGLHVLAGAFFLVVGSVAVVSIVSDLRRAVRRMRERGL